MTDLEKEDLGRTYAWLTLQAAAEDEFTPLLGLIVFEMMRRPQPQAVISGFLQTISEVATAHFKQLRQGAAS